MGTGDAVVRVLREADEIARESIEWDSLPAPSGTMGSSVWVRTWLEVYRADYRPFVVAAGPPGATRAVLPLARWRRRPWFLEVLGVRSLFEPTDIRAADQAAV